jgi:nitroimidazol reductase NimA-like FMN-containing flavoprotein (pyridoxamine 5'-phosphate oxidase superfamily)
MSVAGQVVIVPVNYQMIGQDVLIRVGPGDVLEAARAQTIVAFEVDDVAGDGITAWSVLVQGLATEIDQNQVDRAGAHPVVPLVPEPGHAFVRIRTGVLSGRRFPVRAEPPS